MNYKNNNNNNNNNKKHIFYLQSHKGTNQLTVLHYFLWSFLLNIYLVFEYYFVTKPLFTTYLVRLPSFKKLSFSMELNFAKIEFYAIQ